MFEVFLQSFVNQQPAGVDRAKILEVFSPFVAEEFDHHCFSIEFDAINTCRLKMTKLEESNDYIHSIAVERPCSDERLWERIYLLMFRHRLVLYYPGTRAPLIANATVESDLPSDMIDTLGKPVYVESAKRIAEFVKNG